MSSKTKAIGFGLNYSHNMGPASRTTLPHDKEELVPGYAMDDAPWDREDEDDELAQVATSTGSSFFLTSKGKIYTCGTMHGKVRSSLTRVTIQLPLKCVEIAAGRHFCLARMEGGLAVCSWGAGHFGQLALGGESAPFMEHLTVIEALLPHVVGAPISSISAGYWHAMALTEAGTIYSWGCNRNAQCGFKPSHDPPTICIPQLLQFETVLQPKVVKMAAGRSHSVALDKDGKVYCWGACHYGQCGVLTRRRSPVSSPKQVESLSQLQIVDIAAGDTHTLALTGGGRLFGFGSGFEGQLGLGTIIQLNPKPKLVGDLDFLAIEAGREWKLQQNQKPIPEEDLGFSAHPSPSLESTLSQVPKIVSVQATGNCSIAISSKGHLYVWGCNDVGNLGVPKPNPESLPYIEPCQPTTKTSTLRQVHSQSFDPSHNVILPQRVDCLVNMNISSVAASPTFMWCLGKKRDDSDSSQMVGLTLYQVQEAKRLKSLRLHRLKNSNDHPAEQTGTLNDPNGIGNRNSEVARDSEVNGLSSDRGSASLESAEHRSSFSTQTKSPTSTKEKRRFSLPKAIGRIVRKASLSHSFRSESLEDSDKKGRNG